MCAGFEAGHTGPWTLHGQKKARRQISKTETTKVGAALECLGVEEEEEGEDLLRGWPVTDVLLSFILWPWH